MDRSELTSEPNLTNVPSVVGEGRVIDGEPLSNSYHDGNSHDLR